MTLTFTALPQFPLVKTGDNLSELIINSLHSARINLEDDDILVITQKIVSKAEGRLICLKSINPSQEAIELSKKSHKDPRLIELILHESKEIIRVRPGTILVEHRLGFICANAGIDHSNVQSETENSEDWVLLLPEDPDRTASEIRYRMKIATGCRIGVLIVDSQGRAWRLGTIGTTIGLSGLPGVVDARGFQDLFGYHLKITLIAASDSLAAAATLVMGEGAERTPVVHVRGFPYPLRESSLKEILRPKHTDLFR